MIKCVIIDIDGTLADLSHRLHWIDGRGGSKPDWEKFFQHLMGDTPIEPIIWIGNAFVDSCNGVKVLLCSGRPENHRATTESWLIHHYVEYDRLYMRPADDTRPDHVVKRELLGRIREDGYEPVLVIDDRPSVVEMWRREGLLTLQVRAGEEPIPATAELTLMVGPSGAGKSTMLREGWEEAVCHLLKSDILSSDGMRAAMTGDPRDQSKNAEVFAAIHDIARARLKHGLPVAIDATHLRRKERMAAARLCPPPGEVRYVVVDRPLEDKLRDRGWRSEALIRRHHSHMQSQLDDILAGDDLPNVTVVDLRRA